jgi:tripartite-type tricarboxylate transporter receptor subunit TctC
MRLFFGSGNAGKQLGFALAASVLSFSALAQNWPSSTVTVVVPWPPGGPSDIAARPLAKGLTQALGQPFVIDNRAGGGGNIGTAAVTRAKPDGNTLLITSSAPIVINPSLYKNMNFDPLKDLAPVTNLLRVPLVLVAHPSVPAKNLKELMAYIQSKKGQFSYGSSGNGTPQHLTSELFASVTKLEMTHVPYKGSAPAISDLLGGHIPVMFDSTIAIMPHIKSGKVKPIAISSAKRSPLLPDVPTVAETLPGYEMAVWYGAYGPPGMPKAIVAKLNAEIGRIMFLPDVKKRMDDIAVEVAKSTPEGLGTLTRNDAEKWGRVIKELGITPQ